MPRFPRHLPTLALAFLLAAAPNGVRAEDAISETTVLFTTFGKATGIPLPRAGEAETAEAVSAICNPETETLQNTGLGGEIVGMVLDFAFAEIREGIADIAGRNSRTYSASRNIPVFDIPEGGARCIAVARLKIGPDKRILGYYSMAVLALVRETSDAFVVRPLFLHTPLLGRLQGDNGANASAAISVSVAMVGPAPSELVVQRAFSVEEYSAGPGSPAHVFALASPGGRWRDLEDSAYLPYAAGRPVSIAVAVTENGENRAARAVERLFEANASALRERLKLVAGGD
jgi:hypothetical protein